MQELLRSELSIFKAHLKSASGAYDLIEVGPDIVKLVPQKKKKSFRLGFMALVHGNEILGLPVLNAILKKIFNGELSPDFEIFFALGNLPAAFADKRFLEVDLNRAFGKNSDEFLETRRAKELESLMLDHCDYLIDLHQTISPSRHAFFIFEYRKNLNLSFLKQINPGIPTIVQFEAIGGGSGLSTDEYLLRKGKFGAALELGQIGISSENFELGLQICSRAVEVLSQPLPLEEDFQETFPLYQLGERCKAPVAGSQLHSGWENFKEVSRGQEVGFSSQGPIFSPESGFMLFPKSASAAQGQELFYICTPLKMGL